MSAIRDLVGRFVPPWLAEGAENVGAFGYRTLVTLVLMVDGAIETVAAAANASVGRGLPVDADLVASARGLIRNQDETDEDFAAQLGTWVDNAKENGGPTRLILAIHDYLRSKPRVRVFRRDGYCITVDTDRTITIDETSAFDWDSVSHPLRNDPDAPWWSDLFVVVYTTSGTSEQWPHRGGTLDSMSDGDDGFAFDHLCTYKERDDLRAMIQMCKSAASCIRALIWCSDTTKFVPSDDASMPNGKWGAWGIAVGDTYVSSDRDLTTCVFWEPR